MFCLSHSFFLLASVAPASCHQAASVLPHTSHSQPSPQTTWCSWLFWAISSCTCSPSARRAAPPAARWQTAGLVERSDAQGSNDCVRRAQPRVTSQLPELRSTLLYGALWWFTPWEALIYIDLHLSIYKTQGLNFKWLLPRAYWVVAHIHIQAQHFPPSWLDRRERREGASSNRGHFGFLRFSQIAKSSLNKYLF